MIRRNLLALLALGAVFTLIAGTASAKKNTEFNPTEIKRIKVGSVDGMSDKIEGLATEWGEVRGLVNGIPGKVSEAAGEEITSVDKAVEKIIALDLPMTVTIAPFGIEVDKEGLEGQKAEMAAVIEELGGELGKVPGRCTEMGARGAELGPQAQDIATDIAADPMLALKATGVVTSQVKWLTQTFPHEVEETGNTVKAFFEGLAAAAQESGAAVEEAATTTSSDGE